MVSPPPRDPDEEALVNKIRKMGNVGDDGAIGPLFEYVEHGASSAAFWADAAIVEIAGRVPAALPRLLAACDGPALSARVALKALATVRHPAATDLFRRHVGRLQAGGVPAFAIVKLLDTLDDPTLLGLALEQFTSARESRTAWAVHKILQRWLTARATELSDGQLADLCRLPDIVGPEWRPPEVAVDERGQPMGHRALRPPPAPPRPKPGVEPRDWRVDLGDLRKAAATALRARGVAPPDEPTEPRRAR